MNINAEKHKHLITKLTELRDYIETMIPESTDSLLKSNLSEVNDWLVFLQSHTDVEELKSLEVEVGDRFFHRYNVRIEPTSFDRERITLFQVFITDFNNALKPPKEHRD